MTWAKFILVAVVAVGVLSSNGVVEAGTPAPARETSVVSQLIKAANRHNLKGTMSLFSSDPALHLGKQSLKGRVAVRNWWKSEFGLGLKISLKTKAQAQASEAHAVISRKTRKGDCAKACVEAGRWQFAGGKIAKMSLAKLASPSIKTPVPPTGVPTPPKGTPPPNVTPTVPS